MFLILNTKFEWPNFRRSGNFKVICLLFKYFDTDIVLLEDQFTPNELNKNIYIYKIIDNNRNVIYYYTSVSSNNNQGCMKKPNRGNQYL